MAGWPDDDLGGLLLFRMKHAPGVPEGLYWLGALGTLAFAVSLGLQVTVTGIMYWGPLADAPAADSLTSMGAFTVRPENDIKAYVAGCVVTVLFMLAGIGAWNRHLIRTPEERSRVAAVLCGCLQAVLAILSLMVFVSWAGQARESADALGRLPGGSVALLLVPGGVAVLLLTLYYAMPGASYSVAAFVHGGRRYSLALWDVVVCAVLCLLVYVPQMSEFTGVLYVHDSFFHWDHFIMAPLVAFVHGRALVVDVYAQYGVGWPLLFAGVSRFVSLSHQGVISMAILYACVYYIGIYILLRVAVRSRLFATAGVFLALYLTTFAPVWNVSHSIHTVWQWPSCSVLRSPMDGWFFLFVLCHLVTKKGWWLILAGAVAGLALLFVVDSGIVLAVTFMVYCLCLVWATRPKGSGPSSSAFRPSFGVLAASWGAGLMVLCGGLAMASRGALFTQPGLFLQGWVSGVLNTSSMGVGSRAFLQATNWWDLAHFMVLSAVYLLVFAYMVAKLLHGKAAPIHLFLGCAGLYGLGRGTVFVGRSIPLYMTLASLPLSFIVTVSVAHLHESARAMLERSRHSYLALLHRLAPVVALMGAVALLMSSLTFQNYPNLLRSGVSASADQGLCLLPEKGEVSNLPASREPLVAGVHAALAQMKELKGRGHSLAVLDDVKTLLYVESGIPPWRGDPSFYYNTWTKEQQTALVEDLMAARLDYIFIRPTTPSRRYADTWSALRAGIQTEYTREANAGFMELWRRKVPEE